MRLVARLMRKWRMRGDRFRYGRERNVSAWDNQQTGTDLIAMFVEQDKTRKARKLP